MVAKKKAGTVKSCTCSGCVSCCERFPGWFAPSEAVLAIQEGYAHKMMLDYLTPEPEAGFDDYVYVLAPASAGYQGQKAPEADFMGALLGTWKKGRCVFLKNKLCELHDSGFKPKQCRDALHDGSGSDNYDMAKLWNTKEGRVAVRMWKAAVKFKEAS